MADIIGTLCEVELNLHPELPKLKFKMDMVIVNGEEFNKCLEEYFEKYPDITVEEMDEFKKFLVTKGRSQIEEQLAEKLQQFKEAKIDA